jgi:RNA recognition motif-containing protein
MVERIYIGNLPYRATELEVRELFNHYEPVYSIQLIKDKDTGQSCGYGFVELEEPMAESAITNLVNAEFLGRNLRIGKAIHRINSKRNADADADADAEEDAEEDGEFNC